MSEEAVLDLFKEELCYCFTDLRGNNYPDVAVDTGTTRLAITVGDTTKYTKLFGGVGPLYDDVTFKNVSLDPSVRTCKVAVLLRSGEELGHVNVSLKPTTESLSLLDRDGHVLSRGKMNVTLEIKTRRYRLQQPWRLMQTMVEWTQFVLDLPHTVVARVPVLLNRLWKWALTRTEGPVGQLPWLLSFPLECTVAVMLYCFFVAFFVLLSAFALLCLALAAVFVVWSPLFFFVFLLPLSLPWLVFACQPVQERIVGGFARYALQKIPYLRARVFDLAHGRC